jgi:hypothetical protein
MLTPHSREQEGLIFFLLPAPRSCSRTPVCETLTGVKPSCPSERTGIIHASLIAYFPPPWKKTSASSHSAATRSTAHAANGSDCVRAVVARALGPDMASGENQTEDSALNGRNLRSTFDPMGSIRLRSTFDPMGSIRLILSTSCQRIRCGLVVIRSPGTSRRRARGMSTATDMAAAYLFKR